MKRILIILLSLVGLGSPIAYADLAPPPVRRAPEPPRIPNGVKETLARLELALRDRDETVARLQFDMRGWDVNLVGGSGNTLASFVKQGMHKRFRPRGRWGEFKRVGQAIIVSADIVQFEGDRVSDQVEILLVQGESRWLILGIGEDAAQVKALADRLQAQEPLAPPAEAP